MVSAVALAALVAATLAAPPVDPAATLSSYDQQQLNLILDAPANRAPITPVTVTQAEAAAIAASYLGRSDEPASIHHGLAARTASEAERSVWIVLFEGGEPPAAGPEGAPVG
jgi:hypothetical protein